jgi:hypothetical protein
MPITPFHFGPGLLLKSLAPRQVSFVAFVAAQVVIDLESGYHLLRGDWPVHRVLHTLPIATLAGLVSGVAIWALARLFRLRERHGHEPMLPSEVDARPALVGGLLGGVTHPLFDGIMHTDVRPFWPLSAENPLLDLIGLAALHRACILTGVLGALVLWTRSRLSPRA